MASKMALCHNSIKKNVLRIYWFWGIWLWHMIPEEDNIYFCFPNAKSVLHKVVTHEIFVYNMAFFL